MLQERGMFTILWLKRFFKNINSLHILCCRSCVDRMLKNCARRTRGFLSRASSRDRMLQTTLSQLRIFGVRWLHGGICEYVQKVRGVILIFHKLFYIIVLALRDIKPLDYIADGPGFRRSVELRSRGERYSYFVRFKYTRIT